MVITAASTHCAYPQRDGQAELAWVTRLNTETVYRRTVTHPSTNRAQRTTTALIQANALTLSQSAMNIRLSGARPRETPAADITAMTPCGHATSSVTSPIDSARPLSYRLPIVTNLLSHVVFRRYLALKTDRRMRCDTERTRTRHTPQPSVGDCVELTVPRWWTDW